MVFKIMSTMNISYTDLMSLPIEDVNNYYIMCVDKQVYESMEQMGLHSIDYKDKEKCGTDFYKNYLDEIENRNEPINDVIHELSFTMDEIKPLKIKQIVPLIEQKKRAKHGK
jgi:hypothetical protein